MTHPKWSSRSKSKQNRPDHTHNKCERISSRGEFPHARAARVMSVEGGTKVLTMEMPITSSTCTSTSSSDHEDICSSADSAFDGSGTPIELEEDELCLIGESTVPLCTPKFLALLLLNVILVSLTATWLLRQHFQMDLFGMVLATLTLWTMAVNCYTGWRLLRRVSPQSFSFSKLRGGGGKGANEFKDYVIRVAGGFPLTNSSTSATSSGGRSFISASGRKEECRVSAPQPVFV